MKKHSFGYGLLAGLMLAAMGPLAGQAQSTPVPFDAASARSEQLSFSALSPQFIGSATANSLTFTSQLYESNPTSPKLIHFTRSGNTYTKAWEKQLPLPRLVGMTTDGSNFYVVSAANENMSRDTSPNVFRPNVLIMTKFDSMGNQLWQRDLNSPAYLGDKTSSAVYSPLISGTGAVSYGAGKVVVALASNTAADASIGVRHQRAQYFVVGADGAGFGAASETSWRHSFDQRLLFDGQDFIFTDLGDAGWYLPGGGITVRKIRPTAAGAEFIGDHENKEGTYIYVRQSETAGSQNYTFTAIGGLELGARGYLALFTSEKGNPSATRSGGAQPVTEPRNLGFVHVTPAFETVREGNWDGRQTFGNTTIQNNDGLKINITRNVVDSNGPSATFQRADKPHRTFTQTGIVWLTDLPAGVSAERSKLLKVANDRYVAVWEEWTYSGAQLAYSATKGIVINEQGQILRGATALNTRLNPSGADRPFALDDKAAWITSDAGKFTMSMLDVNLALTTTLLDTSGSSQPVIYKDHLSAGDALKPGDKLQSNSGSYTLVYQADGDLVLYSADSRALWTAGTRGQSAGRAAMQTDGNFAIYNSDGRFLWNTDTTTAGSRLVLKDDGNLVVVTPSGTQIWESHTVQVRDRMYAGDKLRPGERLQSSNGVYNLVYQPDGNLVLYTTPGNGMWASNTGGLTAGYVSMQSDGNFAIYGSSGQFLWNSGTTTAGSWIVLQSDGNLVLYTPAGEAIWATYTVP